MLGRFARWSSLVLYDHNAKPIAAKYRITDNVLWRCGGSTNAWAMSASRKAASAFHGNALVRMGSEVGSTTTVYVVA